MSLPPRTNLADWASEIARVAETQMTATVKWYNSAKALQFESKARFQPLRTPQDASTATAWATKRAGIVQVPLDAFSGLIQKGWSGQFSGGNDPALDNITVTVQSAINSSLAAVRTIHWISEITETPRA